LTNIAIGCIIVVEMRSGLVSHRNDCGRNPRKVDTVKFFAITHADKFPGINPGLTDKGKAEIVALTGKLPTEGVENVIIGTGKRFMDIFKALTGAQFNVGVKSVKVSPLLGSADSGKKTEVFLADGTLIDIGNYIGLIGTPGVDLWAWLKSLKEGTLLCTGREFIGALIKDAKAATVYIIDTDAMTVTEA